MDLTLFRKPYIGSLSLSFIPSFILKEAGHPIITGTATRLINAEEGISYLADFAEPPNRRPLNHHIFIR
jgi:hypothetical protein